MKILHLYADLMNLYGEYANVWSMEHALMEQGFEVQTDRRTLGDALDFSGYDFIYCGSGTERSQKAALAHLSGYFDGLRQAALTGTHALFTGNACELLGESILGMDGKEYRCAGLLDFTVREHRTRFTGDAIAEFPEISAPLVGFVNKCTELFRIQEPLFSMRLGMGNAQGEPGEGWRCRNFLGTHLIGPILVKNPAFLDWLVQRIGESVRDGFALRPVRREYEERAYRTTYHALKAKP